jgi:hypothetical protein
MAGEQHQHSEYVIIGREECFTMTTTVYKYWDVDNSRVYYEWTPDRPSDECNGQYTMLLPDTCKAYKKDCFTYVEYDGELYDLLTDKDAKPYIQVGKYKRVYFDIVED